eukprot:scaffold32690_cov107-Isochrysis_galbana.AAC.10
MPPAERAAKRCSRLYCARRSDDEPREPAIVAPRESHGWSPETKQVSALRPARDARYARAKSTAEDVAEMGPLLLRGASPPHVPAGYMLKSETSRDSGSRKKTSAVKGVPILERRAEPKPMWPKAIGPGAKEPLSSAQMPFTAAHRRRVGSAVTVIFTDCLPLTEVDVTVEHTAKFSGLAMHARKLEQHACVRAELVASGGSGDVASSSV